ncbi:MAG TPA: amidohydrolase family protein [Burkholderiales bacterium]|nr:amidohydrolase family protein [Burkholderiales bacterium]
MINDTSTDAPLVDTHAHVWTTDMPLAATAWHKPPHEATIDQYVATLDKHGIQYAVLSAASLFDDYNEYSLEATRRHKRLRTTVIVRPTVDPYVMRMMRNDGAVGVRLQWRHVAGLPDITTAEYQKFFRRVRDLDWHVHINQEADLLPGPIEVLQKTGVKLVIDHFGHPTRGQGAASAGFQALLRAIDNGRTWVKLSAGYRLESQQVAQDCARALLAHAGPERLLWGSDWPFAAFEDTMRYEDAIAHFRQWIPDAQARRIIGGETAFRLYFV